MAIIWLPSKAYPSKQSTRPFRDGKKDLNYTVCSLKKEYKYNKQIKSVDIKFTCDTTCYLYVNNNLASNTNVKSFGDFLFPERNNVHKYWANRHVDYLSSSSSLSILAAVQMGPTKLYDLSAGNGGFSAIIKVNFVDGTSVDESTDKTWLIKLEKSFYQSLSFNSELDDEEYVLAEEKKYPWIIEDSWLDLPIEEEIKFANEFIVEPNKRLVKTIDFPLIYSAYAEIEFYSDDLLEGSINVLEVKNKTSQINFKNIGQRKIRFFDLLSLGKIQLTVKNKGSKPAKMKISLFHSHNEVKHMEKIVTNRPKLNDLFNKCQYAAINCSQTIILDSPMHCEPLASCSGDYQIISLVYGIFTGDYKLAKHVLRGYAGDMVNNKGRNSNSSYALTFISWLWKIYMITGDKTLLKDCLPGVEAVNKLFKTFIGEYGLIDRPYNYIFNDWLIVDGYSLFCPPKALGQSVYNMFYYEALKCTSLIYHELAEERKSKTFINRSKKLKKAINSVLFDKERGLYCEGLNTPNYKDDKEIYLGNVIPENTSKRYFRKHANVLAVAYGLTNKKTSKQIIHKIFDELKECEIQPFFSYYTFQAIHQAGLDKKYTMALIKEWLDHIKVSDKGLPEGFYKPTESYVFDFSHAWACSPYYGFIIAASGLEILKPGMEEVKLSLKTLGIKDLSYSIVTPKGTIKIEKNRLIDSPKCIKIC